MANVSAREEDMGLDWNPGNKPKPGYEKEFEKLFHKIQSEWCFRREAKIKRLHDISITAFETLAAPQVGRDEVANKWAREIYAKEQREITEAEWLKKLDRFYVLPLVPPCDGIPRYSNGSPGGYVEPYSFRAQFLVDSADIIGPELLEQAYESKLPPELLRYGTQMLEKAESFARENGFNINGLNTEDVDSVESRLDAVVAAGRWCLFWAERGHILEAYW